MRLRTNSAVTFKTYIEHCQQRVDAALDQYLPLNEDASVQLNEAVRYSVFNGGKRVRPFLVYATAEALEASKETSVASDAAACAVELIHAYSLVHDDLPAMDDDDLRRGKPTCHKAFNEATAILAGDALQAHAFAILTEVKTEPSQVIKMIKTLAYASGARGMVGGQAIDLASVGKQLNLDQLQSMHQLKTGALIKASVILGALATNKATETQINALERYAAHIGLAFQIQDDILDVEGDTATLGKSQGADQALNKPTYPALLSLQGAKDKAHSLYQAAVAELEMFGDSANQLRALSEYIVSRIS